MNNFLQENLNLLKDKQIQNPEIELRILLNKTALDNKEIIFSNFEINQINLNAFDKAISRRINNEPISKIFNKKNFWKYSFFVNQFVLDPRPETELIIENVIKYFPDINKKIKILDMCTGSGCIAISLAKEYCEAELFATDISSEALKVASFNSYKLNCEKKIHFDCCNYIKTLMLFDIIVTNPPYLSQTEYNKTSKEIKLFEPKIALDGGQTGLKSFLEIAKILPKIMHSETLFFAEIGSTQSTKVIEIFENNKLKCLKLIKDFNNLDRILVFKKTT